MQEETVKLLQEQIENLQALHALNQMMDKELNLLIQEAQRKILDAGERRAEHWHKEKNSALAEHHKHQAIFETRQVKNNLIKTVHTKLHGKVNLEGIYPEHSLERIETKLKKQLSAEKKRLHAAVSSNHKVLGELYKKGGMEEALPLLQKTQELHKHLQRQSLPAAQMERELNKLPSELFKSYLFA